jgi:hypothetical protein
MDGVNWGVTVVTKNQCLYDRTRSEIVEGLTNLEDDHGNRILKGVWEREEMFAGEYLNEVPEVVFLVVGITEQPHLCHRPGQ